MPTDDFQERLKDKIERDVHDRIQRKMDRYEEKMKRRRDRVHHHSGAAGLVIGSIIVLVGLGILLENMGIMEFHDIWRYWPVFLVIFGVSKIFSNQGTASLVWGGAMALIGALLLLDALNIVPINFEYIWPLAIIAFGLSMLVRAIDRKRYTDTGMAPPATSESVLNIVAIFSGSRRVIDTQDFRGGDIVAVFGGVRLDLRRAAIVERAVIDISACFGGVEIRVPENWSVQTKGVGIFGGFDDKTLHPNPAAGTKVPELVITGSAVFGGMSVGN